MVSCDSQASISFYVPQGTKKEDISASFNNGVLEVHVKKPAQVEDQSKILIQ